MNNSITINGVTFSAPGGVTVISRNGQVTVNGQQVQVTTGVPVEVRVLEGKVDKIEADGSVTCGDVGHSVSAGGSVNCDDVGGNASAGGSINCGSVAGNASAGGSIRGLSK